MTTKRVHEQLQCIPNAGLDAVKALICSTLSYAYANQPLPTRGWPASVRDLLAGEPTLLAQHTGFHVIHAVLAADQRGRTFPLSIRAERDVIAQLLPDHPHALFLFSNPAGTHWHVVNVKYERPQDADAPATARRVIRRIAVGPEERLRTAAERIALLDLADLSPNLTGLTALAIQQRHDQAFDVEAVTKAFFAAYRRIFEEAEAAIIGLDDEDDGAEALRLFTLRLFNRLLFIRFLERKGWLTFEGRTDYLRALWDAHQAAKTADPGTNFYAERLQVLFFNGLNNAGSRDLTKINRGGALRGLIGDVPYLNGGLFERTSLDACEGVTVPDAVLRAALDELLYAYNFTVTESTPLDVEVAVDPEMLGRIFEELVTGRHESGSYYTPKPVVAFMCREALKAYLRDTCPRESAPAVAAFVDDRDAGGLHAPETVLAALRTVRACDPACGSGAYLVGMLHELLELRRALFVTRDVDPGAVYDKKMEIIQQNLYGVDLDPFAVDIARLRLWLSLIVAYAGDDPPPLPNLAYKIEAGDSLTAPAPTQLQPDLFHHQLVQQYVALKSRFMRAHGPEKQQLKQEIEAVKVEIAEWAGTAGDPDAFDWTVEFAEIFTPPLHPPSEEGHEGGGFDIVVANPPYVRQELQTQAQKERFKTLYPEVYWGTADLYVYFYARALQLLRVGGVASFISSNKWLRTGYGKKLRRHLKATATVERITDFGDLPLFGAIAYPQIITFRNQAPGAEHTLRALAIEDLAVVDHLSDFVKEKAWPQPQSSLNAKRGWALVRPEVRRLLEKLRQRGTPLGEYVDEKINMGLKTGLNQAFVVDQVTRDQLVQEEPRSAEVIKPWIRGRNVKRWQIDWDGEYLIAIQNSGDADANNPWAQAETESEARRIFRETYPAIHEHLSQYEERLKKRWDQGKYWWELRACSYYNQFAKPKIIYPDIAQRCEFAFDDQGYLSGNTTYFLPTDDLSLLGFLNSSVVEFYYRHITTMIQQDYLRFFTQYLEQVPIPTPTEAQRDAIATLVHQLLDVEGEGTQACPERSRRVREWEHALNAHVYEVYDLTPAEITLIEAATEDAD